MIVGSFRGGVKFPPPRQNPHLDSPRQNRVKVIRYRNYKHYSHFNFQNELNFHLAGIDLNQISNDDYVSLLMEILNKHAPLKLKYIRANDQPFVTKELRKEHMKRSRLRNIYLKNKNEANARTYKNGINVYLSSKKRKKLTLRNCSLQKFVIIKSFGKLSILCSLKKQCKQIISH